MIFDIPIFIKDKNITLTELQCNHKAELQQLAQNKKIWEHNAAMKSPADFIEKWFNKALKQRETQSRLPFIILLNEKIIGSSSFYNIDEDHQCLYIGYTWLHPDYWGTGINQAIKYLMLSYVFETLKYRRVGFQIDAENVRSRKAVEKLGATQEGILRSHMIRHNGTRRDSVVYSILDSEWCKIKKSTSPTP